MEGETSCKTEATVVYDSQETQSLQLSSDIEHEGSTRAREDISLYSSYKNDSKVYGMMRVDDGSNGREKADTDGDQRQPAKEEETACRQQPQLQIQAKAMAPDSTSHAIDIPPDQDSNWHECCIYRVPINLHKVNKDAYTPRLISIGPFHHGREDLEPMQQLKEKYSRYFLERVFNGQALLEGYKSYLEIEEQNVRNCYAQSFPRIGKKAFLDMIQLDAVFIMELFLRSISCKSDAPGSMDFKSFRQKHKNDHILTQPWLSKGIHRDLLLLENQLPIFVLNKLYEGITILILDVNQRQKYKCFLDLALEYFAFYDINYHQALDRNQELNPHQPQHHRSVHFTDLVRFFYLPSTSLDTWERSPRFHRTATRLRHSGVSYEKVEKKRLLDISFNKIPVLDRCLCFGCFPHFTYVKARLQIPQLKLDNDTECVLRNLIAFEQCHYPHQPYICNYVSLIDSLIHTKDDVELLVEKGVIVHELGSEDEVATLVNGLCKQVVADTTCYGKVINELKEHYTSCWNRTMTPLRLVYFGDLWRAISTVVAVGLLLVTLIKVYVTYLFRE